jgi:predicted dehydrogenase
MVGMPKKIKGFCSYGKFHNIEVEDDVTAVAEYDNNATFVFVTSTGEYPGANRLEISGDKGKLVVENNKISFLKLKKSVKEHCSTSKLMFEDIENEVIDVKVEGVETSHNGILQNFTNAILFGEELIAPGEEGINGLTISNAIHLSDWTGETAVLPIDKELYLKMLNEKIEKSTQAKKQVQSKIEDISGTYNNRWDIKW